MCAWISGVHGYLDATTAEDRSEKMRLIREMISLEIRNSEALLRLWQESEIDFMPVYRFGENGHDYGPNFGECLKKKIALMREYGDELPYIDPNFIWRLPEDSGLDISPEEYLP